jgi:membrane-associated phospholipid phosphatase
VADIFLSYKREDRERAQEVEQVLSKLGWEVFWDPELRAGEPFRDVLADELGRARCVLVLWSRAAVGSDWVRDEASRGQKLGKLVTARIDEVDELPLGFGGLQTPDLKDWTGDTQDPEFQQLLKGIAERAPLPSFVSPKPPPPPPPPPPPVERHSVLRPTLLLAAVFLANLVETRLDAWLTPSSLGAAAGYPITEAFRGIEEHLGLQSFASHDATNLVAAYGYTFSYFFVLPLVCLFVAWNLARHEDARPYRALSLAVAIDYAVSLPFFVFFPVPERWAFFDSEAMLLSDKWSDRLIEAIRPMSGLDNSFPSNHVSLIVIAATASLLFAVPYRKCILPLGATVVLSTFVLGVHWIPDIVAGLGLGVFSMLLARRLTYADRLAFLWSGAPAATGSRHASLAPIAEALSFRDAA